MTYSTPTVPQIAAALGAAVVAGVDTPAGQTMSYMPYLSDTFTPPVVLAAIEEVEYHAAFARGNVPHSFTLFVVLSRVDDRSAIASMEAYMSAVGPSSVCLALEADTSLGGVVQDVVVTKSGPPKALTGGGAVYLALPFTVEVIA